MDPHVDEETILSLIDQERENNDAYPTEYVSHQSQEIGSTDGALFVRADGQVVVDNDVRLISLVHQYPVLYDKQNANYKNNSIRENCWREIKSLQCESAPDPAKRWSQLRDSYAREKRRRAEETKSGSGATNRKGFSFFRTMGFLEKHIQKRNIFTNVSVSLMPPAVRTPLKPISITSYAEPTSIPISTASTPITTSVLAAALSSVRASVSPVPISSTTLSVRRSTSPLNSLLLPLDSPKPLATVPDIILHLDTPTLSPPSTPTLTTSTLLPTTTESYTSVTQGIVTRPSSTSSAYSTFSSGPDVSSVSYSFDTDNTSLYDTASDFKIPEPSNHSSFSRNLAYERSPSRHVATYTPSSRNTNYKENVKSPGNLSQSKSCFNKDNVKRQKSDPIETAFLNVSSALQNHFENAAPQKNEVKDVSAEQTFANLIANELKAMSEPLKSVKKARLMQELFD